MKNNYRVTLLMLFLFSFNANALLIDNGLTTTDTSTGFEWLDVTATQGKSVNEVLSGFGGFVNSGYRYATTDEVINLWSALGINTLDQPLESLAAPVSLGHALFGLTTDAIVNNEVFQLTAGFTDPASAIGPTNDISTLILRLEGSFGSVTTSGGCSGFGDSCLDVVRNDWGSWLVRTNSPSPGISAPATISLLGLAVAGLGWIRRGKV